MTQQRLVYWLRPVSGVVPPNEHPQLAMARLAAQEGFSVLDAVPQSIADQWWFWIEYDRVPELPEYVQPAAWLPVGTV